MSSRHRLPLRKGHNILNTLIIVMKKPFSTLLAVTSFSLMPMITHAAGMCPDVVPQTAGNLKELICMAMDLVNPVIALLTGLAVVFFVWNVLRFIMSAGDAKGRETAKDGIIYGVVGLFVLFSFWGIVKLLQASVF